MLPESGSLVVAVSGGADSLVLLHGLASLGADLPCMLHVATLDHGLRGEAGAADARFVAETCAAWGIPVTVGTADVAELAAAQRMGVEEAARKARYAFLAQVAYDVGATHVATAHNADDQAETVLMHLLRGAGLPGLGGMPLVGPLPGAPELTLIRPLLHVTRAQIEDYAREHELHPREDATNRDTAFLRNRLRHETLLMLREINPQLTTLLGQLADVAATDNAYIEEALAQVVTPHVTREPGAINLPREVFGSLHPALQRRFIAWAARELSGERDPASYVHIVATVDIALRGQVGARSVLPGGLHLRVDYQTLVVERADRLSEIADALLLPVDAEIKVVVPGITTTPRGWKLLASFERPDHNRGAMLALPENATVALRTRRPGDRFAPLGMGGQTKKLKDWMIDRKFPRAIRDRVPLLTVNGQIAAILLGNRWTISQIFAVENQDVKIVYFSEIS